MVGRTASKIGSLLHRIKFVSELNDRKFKKQIEINKGVHEVLTNNLVRLTIVEELQDVVTDDIELIKEKQDTFQSDIALLNQQLCEAQEMIDRINDRLDNTAWRKFLRWIRISGK